MKKIMILAALACVCTFGFSQAKKITTTKVGLDSVKKKAATTKTVAKTTATTTAATTAKTADKYHDNVDDRMKGPKGEKVYIGPNGGRYYLSAAGNKVYVPYAGNKKPVAKP